MPTAPAFATKAARSLAWMLPKGGWRAARTRDWLHECATLFPPPLADHLLAVLDVLDPQGAQG